MKKPTAKQGKLFASIVVVIIFLFIIGIPAKAVDAISPIFRSKPDQLKNIPTQDREKNTDTKRTFSIGANISLTISSDKNSPPEMQYLNAGDREIIEPDGKIHWFRKNCSKLDWFFSRHNPKGTKRFAMIYTEKHPEGIADSTLKGVYLDPKTKLFGIEAKNGTWLVYGDNQPLSDWFVHHIEN